MASKCRGFFLSLVGFCAWMVLVVTKHADTPFLMAICVILIFLGYGEALAAEWRVRIFDGLGTGQVSENATINIGGVTQTIHINKTTPTAYAQFNCSNGQWPFSLDTRTAFYNQQGRVFFASGQGSGTLNCNGNYDLEMTGDYSVNPASVTLQPRAVETQVDNDGLSDREDNSPPPLTPGYNQRREMRGAQRRSLERLRQTPMYPLR